MPYFAQPSIFQSPRLNQPVRQIALVINRNEPAEDRATLQTHIRVTRPIVQEGEVNETVYLAQVNPAGI